MPIENKSCIKCNQTKPETEFYGRKRYVKNGEVRKYEISNICKVCMNEYQRDYKKLPHVRKQILQRNRKFVVDNPEVSKERNKANNTKRSGYMSDWHRVKAYGLEFGQFDRMKQEQNGLCAICSAPENDSPRGMLTVDHCHSTNTIRKLLCSNCNRGLGSFKDNQDTLAKAILYLQQYQN